MPSKLHGAALIRSECPPSGFGTRIFPEKRRPSLPLLPPSLHTPPHQTPSRDLGIFLGPMGSGTWDCLGNSRITQEVPSPVSQITRIFSQITGKSLGQPLPPQFLGKVETWITQALGFPDPSTQAAVFPGFFPDSQNFPTVLLLEQIYQIFASVGRFEKSLRRSKEALFESQLQPGNAGKFPSIRLGRLGSRIPKIWETSPTGKSRWDLGLGFPGKDFFPGLFLPGNALPMGKILASGKKSHDWDLPGKSQPGPAETGNPAYPEVPRRCLIRNQHELGVHPMN